MLEEILRISIGLIIVLNCVSSENLSKQNDLSKLSAGDSQLCIDSFNIHKDKIIRTQDSLSLGGKYLMEIEAPERQSCLRRCCQIEACDVFIYEEKKPGSCYLFHCGPPHDFKCKFTNHANYSSAVLTNLHYRDATNLEEHMKRSQQEYELKSLRKIGDPVPKKYANVKVLISRTESPSPSPPYVTSVIPVKIGCNRNQYECRTSKDCIAIYNVCDGIPQCGDGSDEAVELDCPTEKPTTPLPLIRIPIPEMLEYPPILHHENHPTTYENSQKSYLKNWQMPINQQAFVPPSNIQYSSKELGVMSAPQVNYGSEGYLGDWQHRQMYDQNKGTFPINGMNTKNEMTHYERERIPHIFNHKRPGVIENVGYANPEIRYEPYFPVGEKPWPQHQQQIIQPLHNEVVATISPVIPEMKDTRLQEQAKSTMESSDDKVQVKVISSIKKELETQKNILPLSSSEKSESDKTNIYTKLVSNRNVIKKESHSETRSHHFVIEHLKHKEDSNGLKPKGAVISLALGLAVTAIMAGFLACRLRLVRKRGRRGQGPYAHDSNYLVNGMYL